MRKDIGYILLAVGLVLFALSGFMTYTGAGTGMAQTTYYTNGYVYIVKDSVPSTVDPGESFTITVDISWGEIGSLPMTLYAGGKTGFIREYLNGDYTSPWNGKKTVDESNTYDRGSGRFNYWKSTDMTVEAPSSSGEYTLTVAAYIGKDRLGQETILSDGNSISRSVGIIKKTLTISVRPSGGGSTDPSEGSHEYNQGEVVDISATPAPDYNFRWWAGDIAELSKDIQLTMDRKWDIEAVFYEEPETKYYDLSVTEDPLDGGDVTPSSGTYEEGTSVDIIADPSSGYEFDYWSGDVSGTSKTISTTMDSDKNIKAHFIEIEHELNVSVEGNGSVSPASGTYDKGASISLEANADKNWIFHEWKGDISRYENPTSVTMDSDKNITAVFKENKPDMYEIRIITEPTEGGIVDITETVGSEGATAMGPGAFPAGTEITLEAIPYPGFNFDYWGGDASGTSKEVTVIMDSDKVVTANFVGEPKPTQYELKTYVKRGEGQVYPSSENYPSGEVVEIEAVPEGKDWTFLRWEGDASGSENPTSVKMNSDKTVMAVFEEVTGDYVTLDMSCKPTVGGSITITGEVLPREVISQSPAAFPIGTGVTIEAFPNEGYSFDKWGGDAKGSDKSITLLMNENKMVTAHFSQDETLPFLLNNLNYVIMIIGISIGASGALIIRRN